MANFVEQATLLVKDRATKQLRSINKEIGKINNSIRTLNRTSVNIKGLTKAQRDAKNLASIINKIPRSKTMTVKANTGRARQQIQALLKTETKRVNLRINSTGGVGGRGNGGNGGSRPQGFGANFANQLSPRNLGRNAGRVQGFGLGTEIYLGLRRGVLSAANSPLNLDDARAQFRLSGRTQEELNLVESIAEEVSAKFPAATVATILGNSPEVLGKRGNLTDPAELAGVTADLERIARNTQIISSGLKISSVEAGKQARLLESSLQGLNAASDPERAAKFSDAFNKGIIASGGDLSAADIKRVTQQIPSIRGGVSDETFLQILLARDEQGRRGTGQIDQLFSDLQRGNLNKDDLASQRKQGLRNADGTSDVGQALATNFNDGIKNEIIPRLEAAGINLDFNTDAEKLVVAAQVRAFIDNVLGFSKQGGISALTNAVINRKDNAREFARANKIDIQFAVDNPTVRQRGAAVSAQFQNVAAQLLDPVLPLINTGLETIATSLSNIASEEGGSAADFASLAGAAVPVALGAALQAMLNPETRALGTASLALTGSAVSLTASATALSASAALQGGKGRTVAKLGKALLGSSVVAAAIRTTPIALGLTAGLFGGVNPGMQEMTDEAREASEKLGKLPATIQQQILDLQSKAATQAAQGDLDGARNTRQQSQILSDTDGSFVAAERATLKQAIIEMKQELTVANSQQGNMVGPSLQSEITQLEAELSALNLNVQQSTVQALSFDNAAQNTVAIELPHTLPQELTFAPDLLAGLSTPIEAGVIDGSVAVADAVTGSAPILEQALRAGGDYAAQKMVEALREGANIKVQNPENQPRLDTGSSSPLS